MFGYVDASEELCATIDKLTEENERLKRELASLKQPEIKVLYFTAKEVENAFKKMAAEDGFEATSVKPDIIWKYEFDEWGMNKYVKTELKGIEITMERIK